MLEGWSVIPADWKAGPAETLTENWARTNATKEERMTFLPSTKKERNTGWGAALLKRDRVCRQTGCRASASGVPNSREDQQDPGKCEESVKGCVHTPRISTHYTTSTWLCAVLVPQRKHNHLTQAQQRLPRVSGARALGQCGNADRSHLVRLQVGWQSQQGMSPTMELTSLPGCAVGRGTHWNKKFSLSMGTNFPHGDRLAVSQVTQKGCAVSLLSWTFSKSECIEPWAICQTTLRKGLG